MARVGCSYLLFFLKAKETLCGSHCNCNSLENLNDDNKVQLKLICWFSLIYGLAQSRHCTYSVVGGNEYCLQMDGNV